MLIRHAAITGLVVNSRVRVTGASAVCASRNALQGTMPRSFWTGGSNGPAEYVGIPVGYGAEGWQLPQSSGGIGATVTGANAVGGSGSLSADLDAIGILAAALSGSGSVSASILEGRLLSAALAGSGALNTPTIDAVGILAAAIVIGAQPSADDIAQAVWGTPYVGFTSAGSFGWAVKFLYYAMHNRVVTDPTAGTYEVYDDNDVLVFTGDLWQDAAGATPYAGNGAERRDRLTP